MIKNKIFNQIVLEQDINSLKIAEEDYHTIDEICHIISVDKWEEIEEKLAEFYPYMYKYHYFDLSNFISAVLDSIPELKEAKANYKISHEFLLSIADNIAEFIVNVCKTYDNFYKKNRGE